MVVMNIQEDEGGSLGNSEGERSLWMNRKGVLGSGRGMGGKKAALG